MKKVVFLTGSRSDFGYMYSTLKAINESSNLELHLVVTGTHLREDHDSLKVIEGSGLNISKKIVPSFDYRKESRGTLLFSSELMSEMSKYFDEVKPDVVLIAGDRFEQLVVVMAAASMNVAVAHICGGDVSGSIDDSIRHATTKLAHIHLPGSDESAERILKMGEEQWRVHMVGTPLYKNCASREVIERELGLSFSEDVLLVIQHPVSTQVESAAEQMETTLRAVSALGKETVIIYPNGDPGSDQIVDVVKKYEDLPKFHVFKNLEPGIYMGLLSNVSVMVGNSSSGIAEAPMFKLPFVNIGIREGSRERADNVIDVSHDEDEIKSAIDKALSNEFKDSLKDMKNPYESEGVEENVVNVLESVELGDKLLNKKMSY